MRRDDYGRLLAERGTLRRILESIPEEDVLDRGSYRARLEKIEERIQAATDSVYAPAQARLLFRGRPVVGGRAIVAEFGIRATKAFVDAVVAAAAGLAGPLALTGPIPRRDHYQLLITSTAIGSFGFELEEYRSDLGLWRNESFVSAGLAQVQELLRSTFESDQHISDAAAITNRRAVAAVRAFLDLLLANGAVCTVEVSTANIDYDAVIFRDVNQIRQSLNRLAEDQLRERSLTIEGTLQGILPSHRNFEFKDESSERIVRGKIGPRIRDPDELNAHLHEPARIRVTEVQVGNGRPRYVLNEPPEWLGQPLPS